MAPPEDLSFRDATKDDAEAIQAIYKHYVETSIVTFDEETPPVEYFVDKIRSIQEEDLPFIVAEIPNLHKGAQNDKKLIGYSYATQFRDRKAYKFCIEASIYLDNHHVNQGIGTPLWKELEHRLVTGTRPPRLIVAIASTEKNIPLSDFYARQGLQFAGRFNEAGIKFNRWLDVEFWQKRMPSTDDEVNFKAQ